MNSLLMLMQKFQSSLSTGYQQPVLFANNDTVSSTKYWAGVGIIITLIVIVAILIIVGIIIFKSNRKTLKKIGFKDVDAIDIDDVEVIQSTNEPSYQQFCTTIENANKHSQEINNNENKQVQIDTIHNIVVNRENTDINHENEIHEISANVNCKNTNADENHENVTSEVNANENHENTNVDVNHENVIHDEVNADENHELDINQYDDNYCQGHSLWWYKEFEYYPFYMFDDELLNQNKETKPNDIIPHQNQVEENVNQPQVHVQSQKPVQQSQPQHCLRQVQNQESIQQSQPQHCLRQVQNQPQIVSKINSCSEPKKLLILHPKHKGCSFVANRFVIWLPPKRLQPQNQIKPQPCQNLNQPIVQVQYQPQNQTREPIKPQTWQHQLHCQNQSKVQVQYQPYVQSQEQIKPQTWQHQVQSNVQPEPQWKLYVNPLQPKINNHVDPKKLILLSPKDAGCSFMANRFVIWLPPKKNTQLQINNVPFQEPIQPQDKIEGLSQPQLQPNLDLDQINQQTMTTEVDNNPILFNENEKQLIHDIRDYLSNYIENEDNLFPEDVTKHFVSESKNNLPNIICLDLIHVHNFFCLHKNIICLNRPFNNPSKDVLIYDTSIQKIIGYTRISETLTINKQNLFNLIREFCILSEKEFNRIYQNQEDAHLLFCDKTVHFNHPIDPQSINPNYGLLLKSK